MQSLRGSTISTPPVLSSLCRNRKAGPVVTSQKLWGGNPAVAAYEILTPYAVDVYLREEASADPELDHVTEDISVFLAE